jgi:hypothetical protein
MWCLYCLIDGGSYVCPVAFRATRPRRNRNRDDRKNPDSLIECNILIGKGEGGQPRISIVPVIWRDER